jgi:RNA-directed DNA polymerase
LFKSDQRNFNLNITDQDSQVEEVVEEKEEEKENSKKNEAKSSEKREPLTLLDNKVFKEQCKLFDLATKLGVKDKLVQRKIDVLIRSKLFRDYSVQKVTLNYVGITLTPGDYNQLLTTKLDKINMSENLIKLLKNDKAKPVIRNSITKANDQLISQGIHTIQDRCLQQLIALIFEPLVELNSDTNSYGYRKFRSAKNAIGTLRSRISSNTNSESKYVFDCDIKGFFEKLNHD